LGCKIGYTALLGKSQNIKSKCLFVDPNYLALEVCRSNLMLNNWAVNSSFYTAFISSISNKQIMFYTSGDYAAGIMFKSHAESASSAGDGYFVPTITIDDLVKYVGLIPDFVKIDVEGAENLALIWSTITC
jgi:FkbM family methyltransferase